MDKQDCCSVFPQNWPNTYLFRRKYLTIVHAHLLPRGFKHIKFDRVPANENTMALFNANLMRDAAMKLPTYDVEFIPLERRLKERRTVATKKNRAVYTGINHRGCGRRPEDQRLLIMA